MRQLGLLLGHLGSLLLVALLDLLHQPIRAFLLQLVFSHVLLILHHGVLLHSQLILVLSQYVVFLVALSLTLLEAMQSLLQLHRQLLIHVPDLVCPLTIHILLHVHRIPQSADLLTTLVVTLLGSLLLTRRTFTLLIHMFQGVQLQPRLEVRGVLLQRVMRCWLACTLNVHIVEQIL